MNHEFRVIQGCPVPKLIAPYIAIVCNDVKATIDSIYRGDDARSILNAHGKHSQFQIYWATPSQRAAWQILGTPNKPGFSTHELKSDGVVYPSIPRGHDIPWWCQGFDVADKDVVNVIAQANKYGWHVRRPYNTGSEYHHLNFVSKPSPTVRTALRIARLRATLPKH